MISNQPTYMQHAACITNQPAMNKKSRRVHNFPPTLQPFLPFVTANFSPDLGNLQGIYIPGGSSILYMKLATIQSLPPPKFNSSPLKNRESQKERIIFQPSIFRGYVKLPGGSNLHLGMQHKYINEIQRGNCDWDLNLAHEPEVLTSDRRLEW